ncbi:phosphatase PAP2 family protein [Teredinibacter turnerae]|uniref:phosphatase PAP2 family protein n=1 Tax=Teredinibacter turnerae TaxID=2426 RepID=UPI00035CBE07|nr:phosphatase PAP2 family protein [Teredinibacter turnerae]
MSKLLRWDLAACLTCAVVFLLWPNIDLKVAGMFYSANDFTYANNGFVRVVYLVFAKIQVVYLLAIIAAIVITSRKQWWVSRRKALFLLLTLLIGPGILVNLLLKDNTVGRPRPQHVVQFGGEMTFAPTFHYSGECAKNCSFVSGHAAIAFYLMALAWVRQKRVWLVYGTALGALVGFVRILQGGHFLSDVIFAGWVTYFTCVVCAYAFKLPLAPPQTESNTGNPES